MGDNMKVFVIESELNSEIVEYICKKYKVEKDVTKLKSCSVVVVSLVKDIKLALQIIEVALQYGIEIICIRAKFCKEAFACNLLIKEGANYV